MTPERPDPRSTDRDETILAWTTPAAALVAVTLGGIALAVAAVLAADATSRLLVGLAAAGLLGLAVLGFRQRPRLSVLTGARPRLVVRTLLGADEYTADRILRARVVSFRRLGRTMPTLELDVERDGSERLLIFSRWDLGTDPVVVYQDLIAAMRLSGDTAR
ncbi:PH domain-containing protein [Nocardia sp. CNY236]|uniref:PH domain-containing protein n=1 Tax=Nocardia sp. CNY236 TaxID=1169152 RepID=UPI00041AB7D0|nr:PH domain-containing protein [Nocardia sp. CNY236]